MKSAQELFEGRSATQSAISDSLECLDADWAAAIRTFAAPVRTASERLALRIGIQQGVEIQAWRDHFSPLTLLYASLQNEHSKTDHRTRREANFGQLCALVATFCRDRVADGQVALDRAEEAFLNMIDECASAVLGTLTNRAPHLRRWIAELDRAFETASARDYACDGTFSYGAIRHVAAPRGYPGLQIPLALAANAGASSGRLRRIKTAFDCLMLGMQWMDDLIDWREDLQNDDINLVLSLLKTRGLDPSTHPVNDVREINVGYALVQHGLFDLAARHATYWLRAAARRQRSLGCELLAELISSRVSLVHERSQREQTRIVNETLVRVAFATPLQANVSHLNSEMSA